jgi:SNF2 family DNA or RNA helicase
VRTDGPREHEEFVFPPSQGLDPCLGHRPKTMGSLLRTRLISPYQHEGVKWLVKRELAASHPGGFLCDEMGLGKTVQLIATMLVNQKAHTLVVVPKSIVGQWCDEIARFAPSLSVEAFDGAKRVLSVDRPNVVVAPYSVLPQRPGGPMCPLLGVAWDRVILDEGHEIRNKKSKSHIACRALQAHIRWVVSGTPVFNSIKDFVALCSFVGLPRDVVQGYTDQIRETYVLRRTKESVAQFNSRLELPPCEFENIELEMGPEEKALYAEAFSRGQDVVREVVSLGAGAGRQMEVLEALLRVRQVMTWPQLYLDGMALKEETEPVLWMHGSKKMETLFEMIKSHPKEKTLVFTQFMGEMDHIQERLTAMGLPVFRIDGSVLKEKREEAIAGFKAAPPGAVFLIQIKAGGVGLNLQEATRVYITTPAWNPATELQAIGRAHRTGQTQKVVVKRLVYVGYDGVQPLPSVEQSIMQLQEGKARVCAEVLNDPRLATQVPNATKTKITIHALRKIFRV